MSDDQSIYLSLQSSPAKVSGGPVYVSDHPGDHDFALLRRLVLPDGSILRCRGGAGRPTLDCLFVDVMRDNKSLLKVSYHTRVQFFCRAPDLGAEKELVKAAVTYRIRQS